MRGARECAHNDAESFIAENHLSDSTKRQYASYVRYWLSYCQQRNRDSYCDVSPLDLINYLYELFQNGRSYASLENSKAAILNYVDSASFERISGNRDVKKFMKACFNKRPKVPRYVTTWNPEKVIKFFTANPLPLAAPLLDLSKRLVTLMALTTHQRLQFMHSLHCNSDSVRFHENTVILFSVSALKTDTHRRHQKPIIVEEFSENANVCLVSLLKKYLEQTAFLRQRLCKKLFISTQKPFGGASKDTLARWVRCCLGDCGVNVQIFGAHSTRHASASAVVKNNVSINSIMEKAGWKSVSTFTKHYNCPIIENDDLVQIIHRKGALCNSQS